MSVIEVQASRLIERSSRHLEVPSQGYGLYESWIEGAEEWEPGLSHVLRTVATKLIFAEDTLIARSAMQALACVGTKDDVRLLKPIADSNDDELATDAAAAIAYINHRAKSVAELLQEVRSRSSFLVFVEALAKERLRAEMLEPFREGWFTEGAFGERTESISSFLFAAMAHVGEESNDEPSWQAFAGFLYHGKVMQ